MYVGWGLWENWGAAWFWVVSEELTAAIDVLVIKNLIWLVPAAVCVLSKIPLKWPLGSLFSKRIPWMFVFCCSCVMLAALHTIWLVTNGGPGLIMPYSLMFALFSVCAGITEELLFRGILLNSALAVYPAPAAVAISSAFFVLIHFTQLMFGLSPGALFSIRGLHIFLMGAFFAVVQMRTRNLIVPMLLHTVWNAIAYMYGLY